MQAEVHATAKAKGWWENSINVPEKLALIHSEVSEALEEYRDGRPLQEIYYKDEKPCGFPVELADIMIRVLDLAGYLDIDMEEMIKEKMIYNGKRPYRHGNKKA